MVYRFVYSISIGEKMRSLRRVNLEIWYFSDFIPKTPFILNAFIKSKCASIKVASIPLKFYRIVFYDIWHTQFFVLGKIKNREKISTLILNYTDKFQSLTVELTLET